MCARVCVHMYMYVLICVHVCMCVCAHVCVYVRLVQGNTASRCLFESVCVCVSDFVELQLSQWLVPSSAVELFQPFGFGIIFEVVAET